MMERWGEFLRCPSPCTMEHLLTPTWRDRSFNMLCWNRAQAAPSVLADGTRVTGPQILVGQQTLQRGPAGLSIPETGGDGLVVLPIPCPLQAPPLRADRVTAAAPRIQQPWLFNHKARFHGSFFPTAINPACWCVFHRTIWHC